MAVPLTSDDPLAAARALGPEIRAHADEAETSRHLPAAVVDKLRESGVFQLAVPRSLGGLEVDPATMLEVFEELSTHDGATGWCAMIGATTGIISGQLPEAAAREVFRAGAIAGGAVAPHGKALVSDGGYRLSGRWSFVSGCQHSNWLTAGCVVFDGTAPRVTPSGVPELKLLVFRAEEAEIIDTWHATGLRGTGSHDVAVSDLFVAEDFALALGGGRLYQDGPLYRFPVFGLLALGVSSVMLGIGRRAIDEILALAPSKRPAFSQRVLAESPVVQQDIATAEAALSSGRAYLLSVTNEVWEGVKAGNEISLKQRALLRLANSQAAAGAVKAVGIAYHLAGSSSVYETSVLQRQFRDVNVASQHAVIAPAIYELAGRILLGLDTPSVMV
jgi:indole-3-acetate monooxygenase